MKEASYYAIVEKDQTSGDILTDALCRWYVSIYNHNSTSAVSLVGTYTLTRASAVRWAKRWAKRQKRDKKRFSIELDS